MNPLDKVILGMTAEKKVTVMPEMTVGHVVPGMPAVYGTPTMILHMEMAAGSAIQPSLPAGYVSVGMMVNIRHLAATPIGRTVRAIARVARVEGKRASCSRWRPGTATVRSATARTDEASSMSPNSRAGSA